MYHLPPLEHNSPCHYAHFPSCVAFPLTIYSPPFWHELLKAFLQFALSSIQLCLNGHEAHLDLIVGGVENIFKFNNMHMQTFKQNTQHVSLRAKLFILRALTTVVLYRYNGIFLASNHKKSSCNSGAKSKRFSFSAIVHIYLQMCTVAHM